MVFVWDRLQNMQLTFKEILKIERIYWKEQHLLLYHFDSNTLRLDRWLIPEAVAKKWFPETDGQNIMITITWAVHHFFGMIHRWMARITSIQDQYTGKHHYKPYHYTVNFYIMLYFYSFQNLFFSINFNTNAP